MVKLVDSSSPVCMRSQCFDVCFGTFSFDIHVLTFFLLDINFVLAGSRREEKRASMYSKICVQRPLKGLEKTGRSIQVIYYKKNWPKRPTETGRYVHVVAI